MATNQHPAGRLLVFFLNDHGIMTGDTSYLRDLLHRYVDHHMAAGDQVAIWPVTGMMPRQGFTRDRARLDAIIDRAQGTLSPTPTAELADGRFGYNAMAASIQRLSDRRFRGASTLEAMRGVVSSLSRLQARRKVVVWLGGGLPTRALGTPLYEDVLREAAAANVAIYPISVTGVAGFGDIVSQMSGAPGPSPSVSLGSLPLALNTLAAGTGGVLANRNDFDAALERVEQDAGTYYLVGFTPRVAARDEQRPQRLHVTVKGRDVVVQVPDDVRAAAGHRPLRAGARGGRARERRRFSAAGPGAAAAGARLLLPR